MTTSSWGQALFTTPTSPYTTAKPVVLTTDTFETQRRKINQISENVGDVSQLGGNSGNLVDAVNNLSSGLTDDEAIAFAILLG